MFTHKVPLSIIARHNSGCELTHPFCPLHHGTYFVMVT